MHTILNLAGYRFVALHDLPAWRTHLLAEARQRALLGTVLLAEEGINFFLAGAADAARGFLALLQADPCLVGLSAKESWSAKPPFKRLLVKIKREIIRMDHPTVRPAEGRAPAVDAATLLRWLDAGRCDAGRELVLLDTRNAFEVQAGRFAGALHWQLGKFGDFPAALEAGRAALAGKTVVSYCTGGIRCEKAALLMAERGVPHALQLEGGILAYFAAVGARHFEGECFVFDQRETLDFALRPAGPAAGTPILAG